MAGRVVRPCSSKSPLLLYPLNKAGARKYFALSEKFGMMHSLSNFYLELFSHLETKIFDSSSRSLQYKTREADYCGQLHVFSLVIAS